MAAVSRPTLAAMVMWTWTTSPPSKPRLGVNRNVAQRTGRSRFRLGLILDWWVNHPSFELFTPLWSPLRGGTVGECSLQSTGRLRSRLGLSFVWSAAGGLIRTHTLLVGSADPTYESDPPPTLASQE